MGKARILSAQGEGLYSIEILEDRTRAETSRTTAVQRVAQLDSRISDLESDLSDAQADVDAAAAAQDQAIDDYQAALTDDSIDTTAARQVMTDAGEAVIEAAADRDRLSGSIRAAKAERLTLQTRIERIDALPPLRQVSAWCADYVEDLSGEVATAEVPGEIGQLIIQPGFDDGAAWSPGDDGAIQPALAGTPASVFYNLAMMPGWQKWRPTFRIATISNIDNDLCDITLDPATSSQQDLNVNAQGSYSGVPIMYMDCNGAAFEDGDRVLVAFSGNTNQPMVVGFEQQPKECAPKYLLLRTYAYARYIVYITQSNYEGYPSVSSSLPYRRYAKSIEPRILNRLGPISFYGYNSQEEIEGIYGETRLDSTRGHLEEYRVDLFEVNRVGFSQDVVVGPAVSVPEVEFTYLIENGDGELEEKTESITEYGISMQGRNKWNIKWSEIAVSDSAMSFTLSDSGSAEYEMRSEQGEGSFLCFSEGFSPGTLVSWGYSISLSHFTGSAEYRGATYLPNRIVGVAFDPEQGNENDIYVEYIREDYVDKQP